MWPAHARARRAMANGGDDVERGVRRQARVWAWARVTWWCRRRRGGPAPGRRPGRQTWSTRAVGEMAEGAREPATEGQEGSGVGAVTHHEGPGEACVLAGGVDADGAEGGGEPSLGDREGVRGGGHRGRRHKGLVRAPYHLGHALLVLLVLELVGDGGALGLELAGGLGHQGNVELLLALAVQGAVVRGAARPRGWRAGATHGAILSKRTGKEPSTAWKASSEKLSAISTSSAALRSAAAQSRADGSQTGTHRAWVRRAPGGAALRVAPVARVDYRVRQRPVLALRDGLAVVHLRAQSASEGLPRIARRWPRPRPVRRGGSGRPALAP